MSYTPWLPPSDVADSRGTNTRFSTVERRPQYTQVTIPHAVIGGTPRAEGYQSVDSTTLVEMFRADVFVTAPVLSYDFQVSTAFGVGVTSVNYQIEVKGFGGFADTVVVTGTGAGGDQVSDNVDLTTLVSNDIFTRLASFRLSVSRNGGSGEGAGVRMVTPWILRSPSILA